MPEPALHPVLVVVSGLPGTGKSFFSRQLSESMPLVILESDALRKALVSSPVHTAGESARLFKTIHELIDLLLGYSIPVLLDATSLAESHRERLYRIAEQWDAKVILVRMKIPSEVARQRLDERASTSPRRDRSDADWGVYERMVPSQEPIRRNHLVVDTSQDITSAVDRVASQISRWIRRGR